MQSAFTYSLCLMSGSYHIRSYFGNMSRSNCKLFGLFKMLHVHACLRQDMLGVQLNKYSQN